LYNLLNNNFAEHDSNLSILITNDNQSSKDVSSIIDPKKKDFIQDFKQSELEGKMLLNSPAGKTNNIK